MPVCITVPSCIPVPEKTEKTRKATGPQGHRATGPGGKGRGGAVSGQAAPARPRAGRGSRVTVTREAAELGGAGKETRKAAGWELKDPASVRPPAESQILEAPGQAGRPRFPPGFLFCGLHSSAAAPQGPRSPGRPYLEPPDLEGLGGGPGPPESSLDGHTGRTGHAARTRSRSSGDQMAPLPGRGCPEMGSPGAEGAFGHHRKALPRYLEQHGEETGPLEVVRCPSQR